MFVTRILEKVIPLVAHPDAAFLSSVEEEMVKLILKQGPNVRTPTVCIGSLLHCVKVCVHVRTCVCMRMCLCMCVHVLCVCVDATVLASCAVSKGTAGLCRVYGCSGKQSDTQLQTSGRLLPKVLW